MLCFYSEDRNTSNKPGTMELFSECDTGLEPDIFLAQFFSDSLDVFFFRSGSENIEFFLF